MKRNKKLETAKMFDDELFQNMLDVALNTIATYDLPGILSVEVDDELTNKFGEEKTKWFYDTWDKI